MKTYNNSISKNVKNFLKLKLHLKVKNVLKFIGVKYIIYNLIFFTLRFFYKNKTNFIKGIMFDLLKFKNKFVITETNHKEKFILFTNDTIISKEIYVKGEFDLSKLKKTINFLNTKIRIRNLFDIGANVGVICIPAVSRGIVDFAYAVEPEKKNFQLLSYNVLINNLQDKIKLYNYALSDKDNHMIKMELSPDNSGDHRILNQVNFSYHNENKRKIVEVESKRFDTLFSDVDSKRDLIWIDTQGYEPVILSGAKKLINLKVPIVVEFWPYALKRNGNWHSMIETLSKFSYYVDLSEDQLTLTEINLNSIDVLTNGWEKEKSKKYSLYTDLLLLKE